MAGEMVNSDEWHPHFRYFRVGCFGCALRHLPVDAVSWHVEVSSLV